MSGSGRISGTIARRRRGAAIAVGVVVVTVLAVVAGTLLTSGPTVGPSTSPGKDQAFGSSAVTDPPASAGASQPPETDWSAVDLPPYVAVADVRADRGDAAGIQLDTTFTLASLTGSDPRTMAARLQTDPELALAVAAGPTPTSVTLHPAGPLAAGRTYRFTLRAEDGSVAGSWAFQSRAPLHVVNTLPGDSTTEVPVNSGIEVTFDQDGAADLASHFSISPAVDGRFERHGRTQVFVPTGLRPTTLYTVTVRHGLPVQGTDLALEKDVRFRFETAGPSAAPSVRFHVGRDVLETSPAERPVIGLQVILPDDGEGAIVKPPTRVDVRVYRFPSIESTLARMQDFLDAPSWTEWNDPRVPTTGLPKVLSFSAPLRAAAISADQVIGFPTRLPRGWYLVEIGKADQQAQAFLQVTEVSAWVTVLSDRTVVWVNDVVRGRAIRQAEVRVAGGPSIGRTGSNGLLVAATPADLVPAAVEPSTDSQLAPPSPILIVRAANGHSLLVPFDTDRSGGTYRGEWSKGGPAQGNGWWSLLSTDRAVYRRDDQVETWGFLRQRIDGRVPATVDLRLILPVNGDQADPAAVVRTVAQPRASGAYAASLSLDGVPLGGYVLEALVEGQVVSRTMLEVGIIRKPAYRLAVLTDRHVIIAGQTVQVTVAASFFDGQPVPGTPFILHDDYETTTPTGPTGADGRTTTDWTPHPGQQEGPDWPGVSAIPARPEEGEITADAAILVYPSSLNLAADGSLSGRRLSVTGSVHAIDFARLEKELSAGVERYADVDPNGRPIARARVTAAITELIPVRHLVGYDYDSITKRVIPRYEYDSRSKRLRTVTVTTGANGTFRLSALVPSAEHDYEVVLTTIDSAGRRERHTIDASRPVVDQGNDLPIFESIVGPRERELVYRIGERVRLTMTQGTRPLPTGRVEPLPVRRLEAGPAIGDGDQQPALQPPIRRWRRAGHLHHRRPVHRADLRLEGGRLGELRHSAAADQGRP